MAKKNESEHDDLQDGPVYHSGLSLEDVQRLIDIAFLKHDIEHGHLSADDGAAKLSALKGGK